MKFLLGIAAGLLLAALGGLAFVKSGLFDVSAEKPAGFIEREMAEMGLDAWVERHAPKTPNPRGSSPEVIAQGLSHYRENCAVCHGIPGRHPSEIARGLNPGPTDLTSPDTQKMPDGQLFFIVSHGIRMTGMPSFAISHDEGEIWALVSFVRHLPALTDAEKKALAAGTGDEKPAEPGAPAPAPPAPAGATRG